MIVAGVLGFIFGGFHYTRETHSAHIGSLEFKLNRQEDVVIPLWADVTAIAIGTLLLLVGGKKR